MAARFAQNKAALRDQETKLGAFGLSNNPERRNTPPIGSDRAAIAAASKVSTGKKDKLSKSHQTPASGVPQPRHQTLPAPGRSAYHDHQNVQYQSEFQQPQMQPTQHPIDRGDIFNETVSSGFDQTRSSINLENNVPFSQQPQQVNQQDYPPNQKDYDYAEDQDLDEDTMYGDLGVSLPEGQGSPHQLHRKRSQEKLNQLQQDMARNHTIDNRFHASQRPASHPSLQIRPGYEGNASNQQVKPSKKRDRANEPPRDATNRPARQLQQRLEEDEDETIYQDLRGLENGNSHRELVHEPNHLETANGVESDFEVESPRRFLPSQGVSSSQQQEFQPLLPDYDDEKLKRMAYSDLKAEGWETNLAARPDGFVAELVSGDVTLEEKIEIIFAEKDDDIRASFFAGMPADEWNKAGDHIMAKMSELMQKLKEARVHKRKLVEDHEAMYEAREKAVRGKSENYDVKLKDMKASGEDVLRGKV